jgi:hypothetical protein
VGYQKSQPTWQQALKTMVIQSDSWTRPLSSRLGSKKTYCRTFHGFKSWWPIDLVISNLYFSEMKQVNVDTQNSGVGFQKSLQFMKFLCMTSNLESYAIVCMKSGG